MSPRQTLVTAAVLLLALGALGWFLDFGRTERQLVHTSLPVRSTDAGDRAETPEELARYVRYTDAVDVEWPHDPGAAPDAGLRAGPARRRRGPGV